MPSVTPKQPPKVPGLPGQVRHWFTYEEAGLLCHRAPMYMKNMVCRYRLPKKLVRGPGAKRIYQILLPPETVDFMRRKTIGIGLLD